MLGAVLAVIDLALVLATAVLVVRSWTRSAREPRAWLAVLAVTTVYAVYANVAARYVPFTASAYVLIVCTAFWDVLTGAGARSARPLQAYGVLLLLTVSWVVLSVLPTLVALLLRVVGSRRRGPAESQ